MGNKQSDHVKATHLVSLYGIKCYLNKDTEDIIGTNWFNNFLLGIILKWFFKIFPNKTLNIKILEENKEEE